MDANNIEQIVKQVLDSMRGASAPASAPAAAAPAAAGVPKTSRVAMLTKLENFDIQEYAIPEIGDDDILLKFEGCGVC